MDSNWTGSGQAPEGTGLPATVPEIYLGTVNNWNISTGVQITLDGQTDPMSKRYKQLLVSRPLPVGARVAIMKISGTYVVLGEIGNPKSYYHPENLASDASLSTVISMVNTILAALRGQGVIWNP